jgi:photosystem II stability/assembly factor-like uncharacterized protein
VACGGEASSSPSDDANDSAPIDASPYDTHLDDTGTDTAPPRPDASPETGDVDGPSDTALDAEVDAPDAIAARVPLPWEGGTVSSIAVAGSDDDRILVGGDFPGVWRSDDAGLHWMHLDVPANWPIAVRADPKRADVFWARYSSHAYRSLDAGVTWTEVRIAGGGIEDLALGADEKTIYAFVPDDPAKGLYRSDDDGVTWTMVSGTVSAVVVSPDDPLVVLDESGNQRSADGGVTWSAIVGVSKWASTFVFDPSRPKTVWATNDLSLMRSDDDGATFTSITPLGDWATVAVSRTGGVWAFVNRNSLGTRTIESSLDGGKTWSVHTYAESSLWFGAAKVPRDDLVYVGWGGLGVRVSSDRGTSYEDRTQGLDAARIDEMAIAPSDPRRVWLAGDRGVNRSLDGGSTWSQRWSKPVRGWPWAIAISLTDPSVVWLRADESTAIGTTDDGVTWPRLHGGPTGPGHSFVEGITIDPTASNVAYFGDASIVTRWRDGLEEPLAVSPSASQISCLLATSSTHVIATDWNAIYATDDTGKTWSKLLAESVDGYSVDTFAAAIGDPHTIYFLRPSGVWKTTDGGATWALLVVPSTAIGMIAVASDDSSRVWLATQEGVLRSTDGGTTWSGPATSTAGATVLAVSADGTTVLTLSEGIGKPWISTDSGATFAPISP